MNGFKESFILYNEHFELVNQLSLEQAGELLNAIFKYNITGELPQLSALTNMAFTSIRQDMDRNAEKYEQISEKRRVAGMKGGMQRVKNLVDKANQANACFASNDLSKSSIYDNDNVNDNDLSHDKKKTEITDEEKKTLENYVVKHKLANKNPKAYVNKIVSNGDHTMILSHIKKEEEKSQKALAKRQAELKQEEEESDKLRAEMLSAEGIRQNLASINDKYTAAKIIAEYYEKCNSPPKEFERIMHKYDLCTKEQADEYLRQVYMDKCKMIANRLHNGF